MKKYGKLCSWSWFWLSLRRLQPAAARMRTIKALMVVPKAERKRLRFFNLKSEIAEALNKLKAEYEKEHPGIKLDIQTVGGGSVMARR